MPQIVKLATFMMLLLAPTSFMVAGADTLSGVAVVEVVTTARGTGIMRVQFSRSMPNPAGCADTGNGNEAAIALSVSADAAVDTSNETRSRPRTFETGPTAAESLEREEIRLMTDSVFLAVVSAYELRVLIDGNACAGATALPMVKSIVVSP